MGEVAYEFSAVLYTGDKGRSEVTRRVCYEESDYCPGKKKIPKKLQKEFGKEPWKEGNAEERQMQKLMRDMPGASMYSRDDMADMYGDFPEQPSNGEMPPFS